MKRLVAVITYAALVGAALAQSGFTIRRPVDGAVVREIVEIRIPERSVPDTGFVGIWVNNRFLEAVAKIKGRTVFNGDFVYKLDTKKRQIPDGKMKIECVLYADTQASTRVLGRTSIEAFLDNKSSIRVPDRGFDLRYNLTPGKEWTYALELSQTVSNTTASQMQLNRENAIASEAQHLRYKYVNVSSEKGANGNTGVILMQPMPPKGKDYAFLAINGDTTPQRYDMRTMHPLYMKITDKGRELWGSIPFYSPLEGTFGEPNRFNLYGFFPLPILPSQGVRMREAGYPGFISQGGIQFDNLLEQERFTTQIPANAQLQAIEYERGLRCLRIKNVMAMGAAASAAAAATDTQSIEETYWFALDLGAPIKIERKIIQTQRIRQEAAQTGGGGGGAAGGGGAPNRPTSAGASGGSSGGSSTGASWITDPRGTGFEWSFDPTGSFLQGRPGGRRGGDGGGAGPVSAGTGTAGTRPGAGGAGSGRGQTRILKVTVAITMTLE